ncbi:uncharacterized protein LOC115725908 [Rhodamnia argentea]|uniref:Uncharacterized protein LOC115725908 n=1 Tax=Rhodamnia argentea TaxID=178133 RepID=A0A8B8MKT9_9MYRT|nr:uncharacterized protein LOC115725908 [Rhodamnia argentea]
MALSKNPYTYTRMDFEDPEEKKHRKAQFLIYKVLERADAQRRPSLLRGRSSRLKVKIGRRLKRSRKRMALMVLAARVAVYRQIMYRLRSLEALVWPCRVQANDQPPTF